MDQPSVWVVETSDGRFVDVLLRKQTAEYTADKYSRELGRKYNVVEYRRVEPAPGDAGAGEKE